MEHCINLSEIIDMNVYSSEVLDAINEGDLIDYIANNMYEDFFIQLLEYMNENKAESIITKIKEEYSYLFVDEDEENKESEEEKC